MKRFPLVLCGLFALAALSGAARAEETVPADYPQGKESFLDPVERPDLLEYMEKLKRSIEQFKDPPPSTEEVTALRDAWNAILRPRITSMSRRLLKWTERDRWLYVEGESTPVALQPKHWRQFTRDMAGLVAELAGAHKQYGRVVIKPKRRSPTVNPYGYRPLRVSNWGYGYPVHYGGIVDRQAAGVTLGRYASNSYWHLLNRFSYAWDWRWQYQQRWWEYWRGREQATEKMFEDLRAYLNGTRDSLGETLLGLQALVAALQNAEEERLLGECIPCKTQDETLTKMAETALGAMYDTRLEAERFQGRSASGYGSLLRKWLRSQLAADKVLKIAVEEEDARQEPSEE